MELRSPTAILARLACEPVGLREYPSAARLDPTLRASSKRAWVRTPGFEGPGSVNRRTLRFTEGVGFEPTRTFLSNALAGRRLKPLGHPSQMSCPARART